MSIYKHALLLYKLFNLEISYTDWLDANFQQTFNNRMNVLHFFKTNNFKIGGSIICNRLHIVVNCRIK